ncbi:ABC transporter permease [Aquibacillus saliphilus]|uniref:ABC transporter permease n=1 Tax=Aquibacillus saliphilus TaxID=1909422 RepID=UPI001CEFE6E7
MNIINKLTIRHLKQNKKRTIVTIIGVIISVAMLTAVATLSVSFMDLLQRQTIADEGEWHVLYKDVNKEQLEEIESDEATESVVISRNRGYAHLEGAENENKPYLFIKEYNVQGFLQFPIKLTEGRLPQSNTEIVVSEHVETGANVEYQIGDQLTLDIGERVLKEGNTDPFGQNDSLQMEKEKVIETLDNQTTVNYTVVGFIERPTFEPTWAPGYTAISYLDESMIGADNRVNASVVLEKVNGSLFDHAEEIKEQNQIKSVSFNNDLLRYYGVTDDDQLQATLFSLTAIIMAVIIIGSVSLIYNAFAISVSERSRHLGMLSSVGATKRQKRNSVFFEGMVIGLISIPLGIIFGLVGIGTTFWFINTLLEGALGLSEKLMLTVTPLSIVLTCGVAIITIFISTYVPARKASRISAIDAIRQTEDVKLTGKAVKTSKLIRKVYGIEGEIGLKNLKRNKRRYQVTVFSLVISIVLFLVVAFFTDNLQKSLELTQNKIDYDIQVMGENLEEDVIKTISSLDNVTEYSSNKQINLNTWIEEAAIGDKAQEIVEEDRSLLEDGKYSYYLTVYGLNNERLTAYAEAIGTDIEQLQDPDNPSAIMIDTVSYQDETRKFVETKSINAEIGQSITMFRRDWQTGEETYINEVTIAALTDAAPMGISAGSGPSDLTVIVSEKTLDRFVLDDYSSEVSSFLYLKSDDPLATQQEIESLQGNNLHVYNVFQRRQQEEQLILLMSVFTYGFIVLITAISIANIFNTISTSISLRKREFAMLKSVGMTPKGFNKMMNYESAFYGIKSLFYGLPLSVAVMYLIYRSMMNSFEYDFTLPWLNIIYVIVAIFIIVGSAMLYSIQKIKKENIIDALKQENI